MTKKQRKVAKKLLNCIENAKTTEDLLSSVKAYTVFMDECRKYDKHADGQAKFAQGVLTKALSRSAVRAINDATRDNLGFTECNK